MSTVAHPITAEQLECIHDDWGRKYELVEGRLVVMEPTGGAQGAATAILTVLLGSWIHERNLGIPLTSEPGFILGRDPDSVRSPDFAFIRTERVPDPLPDGYFRGMAPDFAVEVVGTDEKLATVHDKARMWLRAGAGEVWVVNPRDHTATVHLPDAEPETLGGDDVIAASGPLAGFSCRVADLFGSHRI